MIKPGRLSTFLSLTVALSTGLGAFDIRVQIEPERIEQYTPIKYKVTIIGTDEVPIVESTFPESLVAMSQQDYYASRQSSPRGDDSWVQITWKGFTTQTGLLEIPAQKLVFQNEVFYTEPITVQVLPEPPDVKDLINFKFQFPKTDVYLGEPVKGELELRFRRGLRVLLTQAPQLQAEGVTSRLDPEIKKVDTKEGWDLDRIYQWPLELRPFRPGSNDQNAYLILRWQEPDSSSVRNSTGYGNTAFSERLLIAPSLSLKTEALPTNPPDFKGLIGDWSIESRVEQRKLKVQEELVWEIALKGSGAAPLSDNLITLSEESSWRIEGPTITKNGQEESILSYLLFPNRLGELYVPKAKVVNFNPASGTYQTLHAGGDVVFVTQ